MTADEKVYASAKRHPIVGIVLEALHKQDAETYHGTGSSDIAERAWAVLAEIEAAGFTILRTKSYKAAQERQRIAEVMRHMAEEDKRSQREWMERDVFPWSRHLMERVQHLGGLAGRLGATAEDMKGPPCSCGMPNCLTQVDASRG